MARFPFVGPSYTSSSLRADCQASWNLYPEKDESGAGKNDWNLVGTPGLSLLYTLPTSPVRALWVGENRLFCVAGSKFYELNSSGVPINGLGGNADRGDVGNDGKPAQIYPNGNQVMIVSNGQVWIDTGTAIVQPLATSQSGFVNTAGTAVTLAYEGDGNDFTQLSALEWIVIAGVGYQISSVTDNAHLVLSGSAGTQTAAAYSIPVSGHVQVFGATVYWKDGDTFSVDMVGRTMTINGTGLTVASLQSPTQLTLTSNPGFNVLLTLPYWMSLPIVASCGEMLDGYFIAVKPLTKQFNLSANLDGTQWNPLDNSSKESYPDNIARLITANEDLYVIGTQTSEVWRDTGAGVGGFPFERVSGAMIHLGTQCPAAVVRLTTGIAMLGGDPRGGLIAYHVVGYQPARVSTHAVEKAWEGYSTVTDATAYSYDEGGHQFWVISFPTANATWVYDATEKLWHQRGWWNGSSNDRHRVASHGYVFGAHYGGDWSSGKIYKVSTAYFDDAGTAILRQRTAPHLSDDNTRTFFSKFVLDTDVNGAGAASYTLDWSVDGGHTWSNAHVKSAGWLSDYRARVIWNRLGSSRDRVFRVTSSSAIPQTWVNAYVEFTQGNS
jgi:hypothetical protein